MQIILTIITALLPYLTMYLGTNLTTLVTAIVNAIGVLWTSFQSGSGVTDQVSTVLSQLSSVAQAIANEVGQDPETVARMEEVISIVQHGLDGLKAAEAGADPALLDVPAAIE